MNKTLFVLISVIFLFPTLASASYIDSQKITMDLKDTGAAHVVSSVVYDELLSIEFPYTVFGKITGFSARDSQGLLDCSFVQQSYGGTYSCKPNSKKTANYTVVFEFDADNLVVPAADAYTFSYVNGVSEPTRTLEILLTLPEGTGLVQDGVFKPYPEAVVGSTGRRVTLYWVLNSPELGKTYAFTATYERLGQIVNYYGNYSRYIAVFFALAFAIVLWRYWAYRKTNLGAIISVLKDDEKKVFDIIIQSKGKCKQNTIVHGTNFSKAKVSRILTDLEARGLIEKIRVGRTNRIIVSSKKKPELKTDDSIVFDAPNSSSVRLSEGI